MTDERTLEITDVNFNDMIKDGVTLIDFWAPWCAPCMMQGPVIKKLAQELHGEAKVGKANVDIAPAVASELGIQSIPTLIIFKDGKERDRFIGVQSEAVLSSAMREHISHPQGL